MRCEQLRWLPRPGGGGGGKAAGAVLSDADLVLVFGDRRALADGPLIAEISAAYPKALITGCSTAGEITGGEVTQKSVCSTAISFATTRVRAHAAQISEATSRHAGQSLGAALAGENLAHIFVLSEGLAVNGSELVRGLEDVLPDNASITGGLSGDAELFEETGVIWEGALHKSLVVAIGFYGTDLEVGTGSYGGWHPFGPERTITRAAGSVLHELDGRSALALYRKYLGEFADGLPATGLLFPLSLRERPDSSGRVRTILSINEEEGSLTFAGDVPEGAFARLMTANVDNLIEGAAEAARAARETVTRSPTIAVLVSCVGRRLVLRQRIEEEIEAVRDVLGDASLVGFYSYGEIAPHRHQAPCELHNQTMTITTLSETS